LSLSAFLAELRKRDVQVWADNGELRVNAPAGALTPELRTELKQRKGDILAFLASAQTLAGQARALVPLQAQGRGAPVFGVPGHNGDVFCYRALARELGEEHPFFGLQPPGVDGQREPLTRVEDIAAYFAEQIQAFSLQQPCFIAGYCAGGTIAFELAQQLVRNGVTVPLLALFGSPYPAYFRWPTQLHQHLLGQAKRAARVTQELATLPLGAYLKSKLAQRKARREAVQAAKLDPVLAQRARVERATLIAVRAYTPRPYDGRIGLFLPGNEWLRAGAAVERWRVLSQRTFDYFGPDDSGGQDMLREPRYAAAFAQLFRDAVGQQVDPELLDAARGSTAAPRRADRLSLLK
jgi:thioesterase domain-containing protein